MKLHRSFLALLFAGGLSLVLAVTTSAPASSPSSPSSVLPLKPSASRTTLPPPAHPSSNKTEAGQQSLAIVSGKALSPCSVVPGQCSLITTILEIIGRCRQFIEVVVVRIPVPDITSQVTSIRGILIQIVAAINAILPGQTVLDIIAAYWASCYQSISILIRIIFQIYVRGWSGRPPYVPIPPNQGYISVICQSLKIIQSFFYRYCSQCQVLASGKALPFVADPRADLAQTKANLTGHLVAAQRELNAAQEKALVEVNAHYNEPPKVAPNWELLTSAVATFPAACDFLLRELPNDTAVVNSVGSLKSVFVSLLEKLQNGLPLPEGVDAAGIGELWAKAIKLMDGLVKTLEEGSFRFARLFKDLFERMKAVFAPVGSMLDGAASREALGGLIDSQAKIIMLN